MTLRDCERMFEAIRLTAYDSSSPVDRRLALVAQLADVAETCLTDTREHAERRARERGT